MELPKAFNIIDPSLLIAKLKAYDFDCVSLKLTEIYITENRDISLETILVYGEQLHQVSRRFQYP